MPDACGNDIREERLLDRQVKDEDQNWISYLVKRERNLLIGGAILIVLMNIETGRYVLYPFLILSTWVHECCHGIAAYLCGGYVAIMRIYENGGGATNVADYSSRAFIASAGYPGTAVTGCLLLLFRRTTLGPTIGTIGLGLFMLLTVLVWIGNTFGRIIISVEGIVLVVSGWLLPAAVLDNLYAFIALTISLNACERIQDIFAYGEMAEEDSSGYVTRTDATTVAEYWPGDYRVWATSWLITSIVLTAVGIVFAKNARSLPWLNNGGKKNASLVVNEQTTAAENGYAAQLL